MGGAPDYEPPSFTNFDPHQDFGRIRKPDPEISSADLSRASFSEIGPTIGWVLRSGVRSGYLRIRWSRWSEIRPMGRFFRFQGLKCGFELTDHIDMRKLAEMTAKVRLRATN